jgi:O-acetyl-ADP-ribose deacetylase (regulator of RNase III)
MIEEAKGNLLEAEAEVLVNTVNCVGQMGKGIALQFKQAYPDNFKVYQRACKTGEMRPGRMLVVETGSAGVARYIVNFPTKRHWRGKSRVEDIRSGLDALIEEVRQRGIHSIAIPPLGCGNGGLEWREIRPLIEAAFAGTPDVRVLLFEPLDAPLPGAMPVRTARPAMTPARALFVRIMHEYMGLAYRLTLLEVQKLAYFLQESGEPLRLTYRAGPYGPYAENLNHVLRDIEGHLTRGYMGTRKPDEEIELLEGAVEEANRFLEGKLESLTRLDRVSGLIAGFETPYGMELLSSVHWVAAKTPQPAREPEDAIAQIQAWSERKRKMLRSEHIRVAWDHLKESGWL